MTQKYTSTVDGLIEVLTKISSFDAISLLTGELEEYRIVDAVSRQAASAISEKISSLDVSGVTITGVDYSIANSEVSLTKQGSQGYSAYYGKKATTPDAALGYTMPPEKLIAANTVIEYGKTFIENALKKAREISEISGCAALADDSGICEFTVSEGCVFVLGDNRWLKKSKNWLEPISEPAIKA